MAKEKQPWGLVVAMLTRFFGLLRMLIAMQDLMQADVWVWSHGVVQTP